MKPAIEILLVSIGGAVGAAMRFGISRAADTYLKLAFPTAIFPVGTLIANVPVSYTHLTLPTTPYV